MDKDLSFIEWKAACVTAAKNLELGLEDMWASDDPYDLFEAAEEAFEEGEDPISFIEETFEEDLARAEGLQDEQRQAIEENEDYSPDFEDDGYEIED